MIENTNSYEGFQLRRTRSGKVTAEDGFASGCVGSCLSISLINGSRRERGPKPFCSVAESESEQERDRLFPVITRSASRNSRYNTLLGVPSCVRFFQQEFGEFPRLVGRYCSYLLPKQAGRNFPNSC